MEIAEGDVVLCEFYFSDLKGFKNRPVLILKDNLPFNDFVAMPISSKTEKMQMDELLLENSDFADGAIPKDSKVMIRKTFVVSKSVIVKKYGSLKKESFERIFHQFCKYFACA